MEEKNREIEQTDLAKPIENLDDDAYALNTNKGSPLNPNITNQHIEEIRPEEIGAIMTNQLTDFALDQIGRPEEPYKDITQTFLDAKIFTGLSQVLDDIEEYHPREVKEALVRGLLSREGEVAVLFAGMLFYLYGKAKEPFDMEQRPFFLRFKTESKEERVQTFRELCKQLKIIPEKYLKQK